MKSNHIRQVLLSEAERSGNFVTYISSEQEIIVEALVALLAIRLSTKTVCIEKSVFREFGNITISNYISIRDSLMARIIATQTSLRELKEPSKQTGKTPVYSKFKCQSD